MKCPHCGKPVILTPVDAEPEPIKESIDDSLAPYADLLTVFDKEGAICYAVKNYIEDKNVWVEINNIVRAHRGKWIKGEKEGYWEVPT